MFSFSKSKREPQGDKETTKVTSKKWFSRLQGGLKKTRSRLIEGISHLILGKKEIDLPLLEELETILLTADVGIEASQYLLDQLTKQVARKSLSDPATLMDALKTGLLALLEPCQKPLQITCSPFVILVIGVNGVGKTTTIAKLAHFYQTEGKRVIVAAGDTFRAAAIDQLKAWGKHSNTPVIAQHLGADSAAVIYDALEAATARNYDILIADTAGRLHTQSNLMAELEKIKRVIKKINSEAPNEILLVIDAGTGQNALNQVEQFNRHLGLTGIVLTKLDGTAKGGIIFSIAKKTHLPIRFIGIGEKIDDLRIFDAKEFVNALF